MKAVKALKYGKPEVLQIVEVTKPIAKGNEVLIKIKASSVTPTDSASRQGKPFLIRFFTGIFKPNLIFGSDFAGIIEEIGNDVTRFKVGDEVFGMSGTVASCNAEYICIKENSVIVIKPKNIDFNQAASISDGGLTSLVFLREKAKIKPGQNILINGATGNVGTAAIQLAKYYGAKVTSVCSSKNFDLATSLGSDFVIDYAKEDFIKSVKKYDVIFDVIGNSNYSKCKNSLTDSGIYMTTVPTFKILFDMLRTKYTKKKANFTATGLLQNRDNLKFIAKLIEENKYKPVIDTVYTLSEIIKAHRYVDGKHRSGNIVLKI